MAKVAVLNIAPTRDRYRIIHDEDFVMHALVRPFEVRQDLPE